MKNVTITLEPEVARWARVEAAKRDTSVSRFVGRMLAERMEAERAYDRAMVSFFAIEPAAKSDAGTPYPSREELHDRAGLR